MKNSIKTIYGILTLTMIFLASCDKSSDGPEADAMVLPPYESMAIDFSDFLEDSSNSGKTTGLSSKVGTNWVSSRLVVGYWNTALFTTLAVPVASFKGAFNHKAERLGDNKWQWSYSVTGFTDQYTARLTGELQNEVVIWEMHVSKAGIGAFNEFLWFSGVSARDGNSGEWTLNQSAEFPNRMLHIAWERENNEIGKIRYTWVRQVNDDSSTDLFRNSYLEYGRQAGDYDVYYDVHAYDFQRQAFSDVNIEWNSTAYNGRVTAFFYFDDEVWHCWDNMGNDVACE